MNGNVKTQLSIVSKHTIEIQVDILKGWPRTQDCAQSLTDVHLSVSRGRFVASRYAPFQNEYVKEKILIHDKQSIQNQIQHVFGCHKFGRSKDMQNTLVLVAHYSEEWFLLTVAKVILLFRLNTQTDISEIEYVCQQYIDCQPVHSYVLWEELRSTELNVVK